MTDAISELLTRAEAIAGVGAATGGPPEASGSATVARLRHSVIRPLRSAAGRDESPAAESAPRSGGAPGDGDLDGAVWALARDATSLRANTGAPVQLLEATAGLQDLALTLADGDGVRDERAATLATLQASAPAEIQLLPDGPYLVTNPRRIEDWLGCPVATAPQVALCRCGQSSLKPLCDGSHAEIGFSDAKDPARVPDHRDTYLGQQVTVLDNRGACQHSGLCSDRLATVFRSGEEPFVAPSGGRMDEIIRAVRDCPSGALSYAIDGVEARTEVDHHGRRAATIQITRDGPYRVVGGLSLLDSEGQPVSRDQGMSEEHYALCRCGKSRNKPFCSGMHWYVEFHDPVPDPDVAPTIFEWAGGLPALTRMTRLFYEKFVPQDPLLAPLFATMSPDHPERVAKWLGEVFGGPSSYSEEYGGYPRMLSQHVGKGLTEDWRRRWVELLLRAAREAGLPNDAEFRSAFQAYIEWGSRLAVENSQSDAKPPAHMPMPRWDWNTGAGAPGGRVSALEAVPAPTETVELPGADETVKFEPHIRQLFRERDRRSMSFAFDLGAYEDVSRHAAEILERVRDGSMPCDGVWPAEWVQTFARWVETGTTP
jgi:CDGSH-type Zn-finger protein/truncated hemoglobin YjbI